MSAVKMKPEDSSILVSVVLTARNDALHLHECLDSIFRIDFPRDKFEVIYVDAESTDGSADVVKNLKKTYNNLRLFVEAGPIGRGRNEGVRKAQGKIIAFVDSDCIVHGSWLSNIASHLSVVQDDVVGVGGPSLTPPSDTRFAKAIGHLWETPFGSGGARNPVIYRGTRFVEHNPTCNAAYRRWVFDKVGFFDEHLPVIEDEEFDTRIRRQGYRLLYAADVIVWHHRRKSLKSFSSQMYSYGFWRAQAGKRHQVPLKIWHFGPSVLVGYLVALPIALEVTRITLLGAVIPLAVYTCFALAASFQTAWKTRDFLYALAAPVLGVCQHMTYGMGFIVGLIRER